MKLANSVRDNLDWIAQIMGLVHLKAGNVSDPAQHLI